MNVLVTGCGGLIGWKVSELLLEEGHTVLGIDNLNDAYDIRLKDWRLAELKQMSGFTFHPLDICDRKGLVKLFEMKNPQFDAVLTLRPVPGCGRAWKIPGPITRPM